MNAAVLDLELVARFLNTLDMRTFSRHGAAHIARDELASVDGLSTWLAEHELPGAADLPDGALDTAVALRTALRAALEARAEEGAEDGSVETAALLARFPLRLVPEPAGGLRLAAGTGVAGLDALLETVAVAVAGGRWSRVKLCAAPDCRWAFADTSRSGGGRWCSMEICGNRHKTRTYRQRRAG